jgi:hypothetical protein
LKSLRRGLQLIFHLDRRRRVNVREADRGDLPYFSLNAAWQRKALNEVRCQTRGLVMFVFDLVLKLPLYIPSVLNFCGG